MSFDYDREIRGGTIVDCSGGELRQADLPPSHKSVASQAAARGIRPEEFVYDSLVGSEGRGLFMTMAGNYEHGRLDSVHEMPGHPFCVPGLGDGGAHYGAIWGASFPTLLLKQLVREGSALHFSLQQAVHMLSAKAAAAVGLGDRGRPQARSTGELLRRDDRIRHCDSTVWWVHRHAARQTGQGAAAEHPARLHAVEFAEILMPLPQGCG